MPKLIDLTGQKFGELTVLGRDLEYPKINNIKKKSETYWKVQCSCGNIFTKSRTVLKNGKWLACSNCNTKNKINDLTGKKFGKLLVLERDFNKNKETGRKDVYWRCQCECGNIISVMGWQLQKQKSCGKCVEREALGLRFGKLTIKECLGQYKIGNQKYATQTRFHCLCDCGNYIDVSWSHLQTGHTCSCGCSKRSLGEEIINYLLIENNIPFKREYTFSNLTSPNGGKLRFDFAILDENEQVIRLIEFDGPQHEQENDYFSDFEELKIRDELKNNFARENHIPLVRIPYKMKSKITISLLLGDDFLMFDN